MTEEGKSAADIGAAINRGTYAVQKMRQKMSGIMVPSDACVVNEQPVGAADRHGQAAL